VWLFQVRSGYVTFVRVRSG